MLFFFFGGGGTTNSSPAQISNLFKKLISRVEMGALLWDKIKNPRKILYMSFDPTTNNNI